MDLEIDELKNYIFSHLETNKNFPLDVSVGKTGLCLCLYLLGRKLNRKDYEQFAEEILYDILSNTQNISSLTIKSGLAGIGITLDYLIKNRYINGDINDILLDTDNLLLKTLNPGYGNEPDLDLVTDILFYMAIRLDNPFLKKDYIYLFQETCIEYLNILSYKIDSKFFDEPIPFSLEKNNCIKILYLFNLFFKLGFYNDRLHTIVHEISPHLLSCLPLLHSNRLLLLAGMASIKKYVYVQGWQRHIDVLKREFDFEELLKQEVRTKNICISNGSAGFLLAMHLGKQEFSDAEFTAITTQLLEKIIIKSYQEENQIIESNELSLLYGEIGAITISNILCV